MSIFALKPKKRDSSTKGFSLVITISMMVLLSLLAVGMLSLATISLRAAGSADAMAVARNNARLALQLAIGDLQKWAGRDQRVTATANIAGTATGDALAAGASPANGTGMDRVDIGLSAVQPGTRHWTGVFRNNDLPARIYTKTPTAVRDRWLVSSPAPTGATPADASCSVNAAGEVSDNTAAVVLAGGNSVGTGTNAVQDHVAVPRVAIESTGSLPGGLAWWVGDEGVKSRINLERTLDSSERSAALVPQRRGWETVTGFGSYPISLGNQDSELPRIVSQASSPLLLPDLATGDPSALQANFHSATTQSLGLITNTLEGGLRVDLTPVVDSGLGSSPPTGAYDNYPVQGGRIIPAEAARTMAFPRWDQLADFLTTSNDRTSRLTVAGQSSGKVLPMAPSIIDFRILMGVKMVNPTPGTGTTYRVHPCGKIAITIANPYSRTLEWSDALEFEIRNTTPPGNRPSRIWQFNETCAYLPRDGTATNPGGESAVFNQAVFTIPRGQLEPGEARAYTIRSAAVRPAGQANRRLEVPLAPTDSAAPFDFNRCIEMQTTQTTTAPISLDVREGWQTSRILLEMRLARQSGWIRRIEGFELDNGYFGPNTRTFTAADISKFTAPVPLMLYSFQISQPGMDYLSLMPSGYELGQRGSTLRTFADFNLRAMNFSKPIASYNPPPFFMESNDSIALLPFNPPGGETGTGFTRNLAFNPVNWGYSSVTGANRTVLYSFPREFVSLAQFQHADLTGDDTGPSIGHQPANAFGNSYANPFVRRAVTTQSRVDYVIQGEPNQSGALQTRRNYYDLSYLLNASIWDRYFLSTLSATGTPLNPAFIVVPGSAPSSDPTKTAASLIVEGAFNINSTDPRAWKALLASSRHFEHSAGGTSAEATFPRSHEQPAPATVPASGTENDSYSGYRRLSDAELENLAQAIVRQVRRRGPFVSLSHFVNRAIADIGTARDTPATREVSRSGALQYALDDSGINISITGLRSGFRSVAARRDQVSLVEKNSAPRADLDGTDTEGRPTDADPRNPDWANTSRDNNFGSVASILADRTQLNNPRVRPEQGYRSTGIPAWLTQADVLQAIGPIISPRSDTFVIRTCGEARDSSGNLLARAYCEAVVQRQLEYVDPSNPPDARDSSLSAVNRSFGRRFSIVSFRWLSPDEI
ncbi:MAG: hypothetical protein MUF31_12940 [Akkermansiaceae bacterium]|nr:hypothetical protein [Akkermansiaceae bacterium]